VVGGAETAFRTIITGETVHRASVAEPVSWVTGERDIFRGQRQSEWRLLPFVRGGWANLHRALSGFSA
jgi:hypothetical protein